PKQIREEACMDQPSPPPSFEQTTVYQLASMFLDNPTEDPDVRAWLMTLTHPDPEQRRRAVFQLWQQRDARVRVPLLVALRDPDAGVRGEAAHGLLFLRNLCNVELLIAALLDGGRSVRSGAALGLGLLHDRRALEPLLTVFQEEVDHRRQAATAS